MSSASLIEKLTPEVERAGESIHALTEAIGSAIVGQKHVVDRLINALISEGHILLEGLPGLAKTTAVKALGDASGLHVRRIQFTPDMLPADIIGTEIYSPKTGEFNVKRGPIFANLVIADEINRAPAKVQSALLEAMQERQVTLGDSSFVLDEPFLVMATQNPIEQEGTYSLPEAQVDRFLFKVVVGYGSMEEEEEIIRRMSTGKLPSVKPVMDRHLVIRLRDLAKQIHVAERIQKYIVQIVFATRKPSQFGIKDADQYISFGASPRASINLERAAKVNALMRGRAYVTPQDIKDVSLDILRHRIGLSFEADADNLRSDELVKRIIDKIDVP
jgi:MoxR-like ATPase